MRTARNHLMNLLARRNYSPFEIRQKFAALYPSEETEAAIAFARESKWLPVDEEISERTAAALSRKRKGHRFVNQYLKAKGLPPVKKNPVEEVAIAVQLVQSKLARLLASELVSDYEFQRKFQKKVQRLLANRGFDDETIRTVITIVQRDL
jgi:SOS response regulatory protein OraA/RecX